MTMRTPWNQAQQQKRSRRQEAGLAALPGGRAQVNSGRTWVSKRDVRLNGFLVEARFTDKASYSISRAEFDKIVRDAIGTPPGQLPAIQLDFEGGETLSLMIIRLEDHRYFVERCALLEAELQELRGGE